jgi:hypothetical protein
LTNALYYGGVMWHRDDPDREINWDTSFPTPWTREDFERRMRARPGTDGHRSTGRPHTNHALAGLAVCAYCMRQGRRSVMRPITSSYRRKNGTRQRTYVCGHVQDFTGLCHAPRIDAELVDTHVINGLQRYLGDFEAWLEQLLSGYASERHRLGRDLRNALRNCEEQERICERIDRAIGLAETDAEAKAAMRAAGAAHEELERRQRRSRAAQDALDGVPQRSTGRCHARLLQRAERRDPRQTGGGRHTRRVNDALKDIFQAFVLDPPGEHPLGEGTFVIPVLRPSGEEIEELARCVAIAGDLGRCVTQVEPITPPLRTLHVHPEQKDPIPSRSGR